MTNEIAAFAEDLGKVLDELVKVSNLPLADLKSPEMAYKSDWLSQPLRQMFVRSCWALIEGEAYRIKQFTLCACKMGGKSLSADEHDFLSEVQVIQDQNGVLKEKDVRKGSLENLKKRSRSRLPSLNLNGLQTLAIMPGNS